MKTLNNKIQKWTTAHTSNNPTKQKLKQYTRITQPDGKGIFQDIDSYSASLSNRQPDEAWNDQKHNNTQLKTSTVQTNDDGGKRKSQQKLGNHHKNLKWKMIQQNQHEWETYHK